MSAFPLSGVPNAGATPTFFSYDGRPGAISDLQSGASINSDVSFPSDLGHEITGHGMGDYMQKIINGKYFVWREDEQETGNQLIIGDIVFINSNKYSRSGRAGQQQSENIVALYKLNYILRKGYFDTIKAFSMLPTNFSKMRHLWVDSNDNLNFPIDKYGLSFNELSLSKRNMNPSQFIPEKPQKVVGDNDANESNADYIYGIKAVRKRKEDNKGNTDSELIRQLNEYESYYDEGSEIADVVSGITEKDPNLLNFILKERIIHNWKLLGVVASTDIGTLAPAAVTSSVRKRPAAQITVTLSGHADPRNVWGHQYLTAGNRLWFILKRVLSNSREMIQNRTPMEERKYKYFQFVPFLTPNGTRPPPWAYQYAEDGIVRDGHCFNMGIIEHTKEQTVRGATGAAGLDINLSMEESRILKNSMPILPTLVLPI